MGAGYWDRDKPARVVRGVEAFQRDTARCPGCGKINEVFPAINVDRAICTRCLLVFDINTNPGGDRGIHWIRRTFNWMRRLLQRVSKTSRES